VFRSVRCRLKWQQSRASAARGFREFHCSSSTNILQAFWDKVMSYKHGHRHVLLRVNCGMTRLNVGWSGSDAPLCCACIARMERGILYFPYTLRASPADYSSLIPYPMSS
jgi:hypothetical protein